MRRVIGPLTRMAAVTAAVLLLAGCATPASYHPRQDGSGTGYTEMQLAANRWRVTFTGNAATERQTVENYLLLRAAEVTRQAGYRWFVFDNRNTEAQTTYQSDFVGWPGWRGRYWHSWPYGGWDAGADIRARPITSYEAYAEIVLLTDEQAKAEPRAMQAQDVIDHVGPTAQAPSHPAQ